MILTIDGKHFAVLDGCELQRMFWYWWGSGEHPEWELERWYVAIGNKGD